MTTECTEERFLFQAAGRREIVAAFDGGEISSDGGVLLVSELESKREIVARFARCFTDHRDPDRIEHSCEELLKQRIFTLALGHEDVEDHDQLRRDPLLAAAVGKVDVLGAERDRAADRGNPLAGKSTINRLELSAHCGSASDRYKRFEVDTDAIDELLVDLFLESYAVAPPEIILDVDATDDPVHGKQEGRFFHGYYDKYCYLPLYVFCGDHLLLARLRPGNHDPAKGAMEELARITEQIHRRWPQTRIIVRGDSGFCREEIMRWCEESKRPIDYVFGLPRNDRLLDCTGEAVLRATARFECEGAKVREITGFHYRTIDSWSRERRVVARVELDAEKLNDRYVVTSLSRRRFGDRALYYDLYCGRGDMENRIKEQQLGLFADRTSTHHLRSNQMRLYFSSIAYVLLAEVRRVGLAGTKLERAQSWTLRTRLLKIGAVVRVTTRKVWVSLSSAFPHWEEFRCAYERIVALQPLTS